MRLLILLVLAAPLGASTIFTDAPGELGPVMLILDDVAPTNEEETVDQTVSLHPGWNLVSWHVKPLNPPIFMWQILPYEGLPPPYEYADWFHEHGGNLYTYEDATFGHCYPLLIPESYQWIWDLNHAYYIWLDISHSWLVENRERFGTPTFDIEPDPAWATDDEVGSLWATGWFFVGYSAPGLTKLATVYDQWPPPNGQSQYNSYVGPFHWLYWDEQDAEKDHYCNTPPGQYLTIVKTPDGKIYIPYDPSVDTHVFDHGEPDEIGILEPGRGYFLGFKNPTGMNYGMDHFSWQDYPGWPQNSLPPEPEPELPMISSSAHFQFKPLTHLFYPIFIDTIALEGISVAAGDEIGVFTPDSLCVGARVFDGEFPVRLNAWKDDIATPEILDGYQSNQEMIFKLYDQSANQEITFIPPPGTMGQDDDPVAPTHSGFGVGIFAIRSLIDGISATVQLPQAYALGQNYPNPFNAETVIPLELPQRSEVKIELFNIRGQSLGVIYDAVQEAGWPRIRYRVPAHLASGVYFYRIETVGLEHGGHFADVRKMLLLK